MEARMRNGPPIMNAITTHVFAISPILPSPLEAWLLRTKPQSAKRAPNPVKTQPILPRIAESREDPADPAQDRRLPAGSLGEPAEDDAPVVRAEHVQQVRDGRVGKGEIHPDAPPASAVVQSRIPRSEEHTSELQ